MSEITEGPMAPDAAYLELAAAYTESTLLAALRAAGLGPGDVVFVCVCLDTLGPGPVAAGAERGAMLLRVLRDVVGDTGTLIFPAYTFSFCRQERFDVDRSPTRGGEWSTSADVLEYARQSPGAMRSRDPIHSVTAIGPDAARLLKDLPSTCFGEDCLQHRLLRAGAKICLIGIGPHEASMVHYAEVTSKVPFRYKKLFTGEIVEPGSERVRRAGWIYDVRVRCQNTELDDDRIEREAAKRGVLTSIAIGRNALHVVDARQFYDFLREEIAADPWFTVKGPPVADLVELERLRVEAASPAVSAAVSPAVTLPPDASMEEIVNRLWMVRRDIVSDGYDAALAALATQAPMGIHEYPSGTECFTWIAPEKWTCHEAYLETIDGRRLFSYADHPLHVVSNSLPFDGVVTRDELMRHLYVHPRLTDAIPFIFKYYERDWGLCCSQRLCDSLQDPRYRVRIRTSFSYGTLKVGEIVVPGRTDETIVLAAHLCHPGMANDDLAGVAVAFGVIRELLRDSRDSRESPQGRPSRRYTYRLLILPETIGSLAYLSDHQALVPLMKGGLFLEMLGLEHPLALQRSFSGDTDVDACFVSALRRYAPSGWTAPFRTLLGNDERQFNAPGVRVPMLSLMRVLPTGAADYPYREYHSSDDTPATVSPARLAEARDLVLRMIETLESSRVPINNYAGEVCCSRYGLHIDWYSDPEAHKAMFAILDLVDGTRSIAQIAQATGQSDEVVTRVLDPLEARGLIGYGEVPS